MAIMNSAASAKPRNGQQTRDRAIGMMFKAVKHQSIELRIAGYQFPEATNELDRNWLNIGVKVDTGQEDWEAENPALLTWELLSMVHWFERLAARKRPHYNHLCFTEPTFRSSLLNLSTKPLQRILILFDMELRPRPPQERRSYFVDIVADNAELQRTARKLEKELVCHPELTGTMGR